MAPIHASPEQVQLGICILVRATEDPGSSPFVLLRELPGSRVYLGAVCDAQARVLEWLEVWLQTMDMRDITFSGYQETLSNFTFDQRWVAECEAYRKSCADTDIVTGMETKNPTPLLIKREAQGTSPFASIESTQWQLCKDDALLSSFGLPPYSTSPYRYLHDPEAKGAKTFLGTAADAPTNSHVQGIERLGNASWVIFNPHAGLIRITRFDPLELGDYLQILEGAPWNGPGVDTAQLLSGSTYSALRAWSSKPAGLPFLLHGNANPAERLTEVFFLKLSALHEAFKGVRRFVKAHQLPLLNVTPASFRIALQDVGEQFPSLWTARVLLVKPSQAYPLRIKSTEQRYFIRFGKIETSPYLPEGLGAHSFGVGSVLIRNIKLEAEGAVIEGTLRAEDYLGLAPHDLLWFKLPLGEERLEFYSHVYTSETVGPKEARFRTVPTKLSEPIIAAIKKAAGTQFPRSPYEIWPLLSSPCDMFSLGVMAVRFLLANSQSNLPVVLDEVLSLARHLGKEEDAAKDLPAKLKATLERDPRLAELISPHALIESGASPQQAKDPIRPELWLEAIAILLRLFPGAGSHSYCRSLGDVSPLALETVFDRPIQELEVLILRIRSVLLPSLAKSEEIADVILEQLAAV